MAIANLKIGRREFVVIPKKEYESLLASKTRSGSLKQSEEDRMDIAIARKRLSDPRQKPIPYQQARKSLGLA